MRQQPEPQINLTSSQETSVADEIEKRKNKLEEWEALINKTATDLNKKKNERLIDILSLLDTFELRIIGANHTKNEQQKKIRGGQNMTAEQIAETKLTIRNSENAITENSKRARIIEGLIKAKALIMLAEKKVSENQIFNIGTTGKNVKSAKEILASIKMTSNDLFYFIESTLKGWELKNKMFKKLIDLEKIEKTKTKNMMVRSGEIELNLFGLAKYKQAMLFELRFYDKKIGEKQMSLNNAPQKTKEKLAIDISGLKSIKNRKKNEYEQDVNTIITMLKNKQIDKDLNVFDKTQLSQTDRESLNRVLLNIKRFDNYNDEKIKQKEMFAKDFNYHLQKKNRVIANNNTDLGEQILTYFYEKQGGKKIRKIKEKIKRAQKLHEKYLKLKEEDGNRATNIKIELENLIETIHPSLLTNKINMEQLIENLYQLQGSIESGTDIHEIKKTTQQKLIQHKNIKEELMDALYPEKKNISKFEIFAHTKNKKKKRRKK